MESVRCYLCDHEFVEGEEPWLMFEQRLREDGQVECSLADLLGNILEKELEEALAHSTLLCDSCNADVLEYESLEKRFSQIRERILSSYKENSTIQNLNNLLQGNVIIANGCLPQANEENSKFLVNNAETIENISNGEYLGITEMDLVEEVQDDELECEENLNVNDLDNEQAPDHDDVGFIDNVSSQIVPDHFDFAAFNEHVAQNSLPAGVLNLSDGLVNLEVSEESVDVQDIPLEGQDIIIYDVNTDQIQQGDLIIQQDSDSRDLKTYDSTEDGDLNFIISTDIFTSEGNCENSQQSAASEITQNDNIQQQDASTSETKPTAPKVVCKQDGDTFICLICEISPHFERQTLVEHFQTFHNSKFYMCEQCHEGFGKRQDLKLHTELGHIIQCEHCERTFNNNRLYRIHKRVHYNNTKQYECHVCQKMYVSKAILEEHMNTHTGVRPFKCSECPKDFASKYTLQTHMKIHKERPRPYQCDQCDKRFLNQQNLNQHKKLHVSVKAFHCEVCNKAFTTQHSLQVHKIVHSGQRPFICRICGKSFARRPEIKDHERIHTGEKPFKCEYCPMAFAQRTNLASHKKSTHLNEKLHKCDLCLRSFKRKRLLDYHIQAIHTGERPHKCEICGAGFVYPEHYKKHMLIHSGKKPYACEVCGKQFNSRDNRNAHRFVHSDKKPYECMECGAGFMRKPLLLTHMKQTKHINDTIIINQPQFTQHQPMEIGSITSTSSSAEYNNLNEEESEIDVDNDLKSQEVSDETLEKIIFKADDLLAENVSVASITDKVVDQDENVITAVGDHLMKNDLDNVKYLEFEDLEHDGHQTLTWVNIGDDKV
ncbi:zinc finger protein 431-like [Lucilia cuprina]|uniref:zinc finger protein 431-like n=1 Tax=Lucilia cuprina TaxID=7375 RepID=UPI001F06AA97|nr:zinc finger protein 431-like [Lucilia cuprina]XP_046811030.1 zinc finger protein 431-like [Lucilia cuprina]